MSNRLARFSLALSLLGVTLFHGSPAAKAPPCHQRDNNSYEKLLACVTLDGVREHQAALQAIADANGGTRLSGTAGFNQSVAYAQQVLTDAGYAVTVQPFQFLTFFQNSPSVLEQVAPPPAGPVEHKVMTYSGSGDATAAVTVVPSLGCDAADFAGFPAGNIALIIRGNCAFAIKATNAFSAGASGVVIYNSNVSGPINGTLGNDFTLDIPVVEVTNSIGQQLAGTPGLIMRIKTDAFRGFATSYNVLAESKAGDPNNVVMAGGHLDSVAAGPGIQDNGSGSAAILEIARQMAKVKPRNKIRFALWGAEESGLIGSRYYVDNLSQEDKDRIALYLNFDMIGSPNYGLFVYNAFNGAPGPAGSEDIQQTFEQFYARFNLPFEGTDIGGAQPGDRESDHAPFILAGIPAGGVITGAGSIKTADQAAKWGGTAGLAFDPCYHQACDTFDNVSLFALDINSDAAAFAILKYAMNTSEINGKRGKGNFQPKVLAHDHLKLSAQ